MVFESIAINLPNHALYYCHVFRELLDPPLNQFFSTEKKMLNKDCLCCRIMRWSMYWTLPHFILRVELNWGSIIFGIQYESGRDFYLTLVKESRWLSLSHFKPLLKCVVFESAGTVVKISLCLKIKLTNQVKTCWMIFNVGKKTRCNPRKEIWSLKTLNLY